MSLIHPSWTRDTTEKLGDGATYVLNGAAIMIAGVTYRLPAAVFALGDQSDWVVSMGGEWERLRATVSNLDPFTLTRDLTWESTNNDQPVNWQSGTKDVYVVFGADVALLGAANVFTDTQTVVSSDGGSIEGPALALRRESASPTNLDHIGVLRFDGRNAADQDIDYVKIRADIRNTATGAERGAINFDVRDGGVLGTRFQIRGDLVRTFRSLNLSGFFLHLDFDSLASVRSTDGQSMRFRVNSNDRLELSNQLLRLLGIGLESGAITASGAITTTGDVEAAGSVRSNTGHLRTRANAANRHLWFEALNGAEHAAIWHDAPSNALLMRTRDGPGGSITAQLQLGPAAGVLAINGAQVATRPVDRAQLKTSTTSQTGSINNGSNVLVTMDPYTFWPRIEGNIGLRFAPQQGEGSVDSTQFRIVNDTGSSQGYAVRWRRIDA